MFNILPLEIENLIMKYRGNIKPPHFYIYNHYLMLRKLHEEIEEIQTYFEYEDDDLFEYSPYEVWYYGQNIYLHYNKNIG